MKGTSWLYLWLGGLLLGSLRGILEVIRLRAAYPIVSHPVILTGQLVTGYAIGIAFFGLFLAGIARYVLIRHRDNYRPYLPAAWFLALVVIDLWGAMTPVAPTARMTRGMPPHFPLPEPHRDVLIITVDTCRSDHLGAYGNSKINTPTLDMLARHGVTVMETVAPIPITTSSHATIFTGQDPPMHGSRFNAVPLSPASRTMAEVFRDHSFRTGAFISAFPVVHDVSGLGRGFEIYDQLLTPSVLHPLVFRSTLLQGLTRYGPFRPAERRWHQVIPSVRKWWEGLHDEASFTWVHFYDPHFPYRPGFPYDKMYLDHTPRFPQTVLEIAEINNRGLKPDPDQINEFKALYAGEVSAVDHAINELLRNLAERDRLQRTLVVITADHGESLEEHGYYFSHGDDLYDPSLKVPMIAFLKGCLPESRLVAGQLRLADLAGTVYSLTGVNGFNRDERNEIVDAWLGKTDALPQRYAFCETGSGVYIQAHQPNMNSIRMKQRAIRSETRKVIWKNDSGMTGFHLDSDPAETNPVRDPKYDEFTALSSTLTQYVQQTDPPDAAAPILPGKDVLEELRMLGYID
ncbi:sulfatase [bacterium]|nr:sulfatase [candidate division CSSED10-310 bacterium]